MNTTKWNSWIAKMEWIVSIAKKRKWHIIKEIQIQPPITLELISNYAKESGLIIPKDFIEVLTKYSAGVNFYVSIEGEKPEGIYRQIFSAGYYDGFWDFEIFKNISKDYDSDIKESFPNLEDDFEKIWHNKIPFIYVPTGDYIAFDTSNKSDTYPVVYLSHDGDDSHGKRLGYNFIDFIDRWSLIGFFGPEYWQLEPFYDAQNNVLKNKGEEVENWIKWLAK